MHGVVFYAHPRHHRFPWSGAENVANSSLRRTFYRRAFKLHKRPLAAALWLLLRHMDAVVSTDSWQRAATRQCPSQVWRHAHGLTEYQVWTCYRIASMQLNLYHAGRQEDNSCRASSGCHGIKESPAHIFWDCLKARACWGKLLRH